ncbi:phospholipid scramblase-related protein [Flavobacterium subsaxonicum]|uniref:Scramblase n=1 Tax=Flavobacterium subsaxonicum WB 4.1-42 = DSM 21790 TaxID=1121898 RepID=A0A0A2MIP7_9FLAO|nr:phospholipid scramblase-related protein [Flavobacterium subsaxonicum]KGO92517.1 scramblase [Flavobacterium subsaxonicum WB 4.1-42 = DSM 21790]
MAFNFFDSDSYFIDEKVNFFKFENTYNIYNDIGAHVGAVKQKLTTGQKMLRLLLKKPMLPFLLEIKNTEDEVQASISRGWTFWMSKIVIKDPQDNVIGTIKQKFKFFKPTFKIFDATETQIAEINGDWKAWNFTITDAKGVQIGNISKKWAGAVKEIFTSADKYNVNINPDYPENTNKIVILAGAITIDMVLKESK